jgi:hypothetical protein
MKKIFYCLVAALVLAACVKEDASIAKVEEVKNPYAVTPDEAVQLLKSVMGGESTRAISVGEIKTLRKSDFVPTTRGAEDGDVIYIVDLENGGSAVMGADKRMEPIYAILDETKISPDKLTLTATRTDDGEQDIEEYVMGLMNAKISSDFAALRPPLDTLPIPSLRSEYWLETTTLGQKTPMLRTKWNQRYPYNSVYCQTYGYANAPVGCAVIAISQIMAYHNMNMTNTNYNWNIINSFIPGYADTASDGEKTYVGNYVYQIRQAITPESIGGIGINEVALFMILKTGYKNVGYISYSINDIKNMLNFTNPVYMQGHEVGDNSAHAWVIDGYHNYKIDEWERSYFGEFVDEEKIIATYYYNIVHCNYGWGGLCDGYYTDGIFNTTIEIDDDMIDTSVGDSGGSNVYNFNSGLTIIKYTR